MKWQVRHYIPEGIQALKLINSIGRGGNNIRLKMVCRMWNLYELSSLRSTASDIWATKTTSSLLIPPYIGFRSTEKMKIYQMMLHN